jgi:glycerophosphoryl diester phosphodiesterase
MRRWIRRLVVALLLFAAFVYLNNTALLAPARREPLTLLAHRGLHQTFGHEDLKADTCTAAQIRPPMHTFLENTLASMEAAFRLGADVVEFDIHPTTDGQFAVFHDWTLECRTNGTGVTRQHSLAQLKALDIGHGYTVDGKTFPFRGKGLGLMPSLDEVLARFPDKHFLIHVKGNDPAEGERLADRLAQLPRERLAALMVYGGDRPVTRVAERIAVRTMTGRGLKSCLKTYLGLGWSGHVPTACRNSVVLVPVNYAHWLWGWPDRFLDRMRRAGTEVFVVGPWAGEEFSRGIDDADELRQLPKSFTGGVWTNRIELIAPLARSARP